MAPTQRECSNKVVLPSEEFICVTFQNLVPSELQLLQAFDRGWEFINIETYTHVTAAYEAKLPYLMLHTILMPCIHA